MGTTPPDFRIPSFEDEPTQRTVVVHDVKPIADAAAWLVAGERKRAGQLSVIVWMLGVAITAGGGFAAWLTTKVIDLQAAVSAVAQHVDDVDRKDGTR